MAQLRMLFFVVAALAVSVCVCVQLPDVHWNSSNTMFSNVDPPVLSVWMKDRIHIQCPHFKPNQLNADFAEYLTIYQVSKWGFENCVLDGSATLLMRCSSPFAPTRPLSITFREWTPNPTAPEFQPGQSYYFISTSGGSKSNLHQTSGGLCASKGLRMKIDVNGYRKKKPANNFQLDQPMSRSVDVQSPTSQDSHAEHSQRSGKITNPPRPEQEMSPKFEFKKARYDYLSADQPQTYKEYKLETQNIPSHKYNYNHDDVSTAYGHLNPHHLMRSRIYANRGYPGREKNQGVRYPDRRDYLVESMDDRDGLEQIEILVGYAESQNSASSTSLLTSLTWLVLAICISSW